MAWSQKQKQQTKDIRNIKSYGDRERHTKTERYQYINTNRQIETINREREDNVDKQKKIGTKRERKQRENGQWESKKEIETERL